MKDEEIETMVNKIGEVAPDQVANFLANPEAFDYSVLEGYSDFTDKYKSIADFVGDKNAIKAQIWNNLNGKFPSDARFQSLQEQYPWLNKEDLKEWFDKTNEYKKEFELEREIEAGKVRRAKEIKERGLDDPRYWLASEYENQRYIDDPNSAIFGKEAPGFMGSSAGAKADLISGVLGAAGDAVPGYGAFIGPTVRSARDAVHYLGDSPYKKDLDQIFKDAALDYGTNVAAWKLLNARKLAKGTEELGGSKVQQAFNVANATKALDSDISNLTATFIEGTDKDIINAVNNVKYNPLRQELENITNKVKLGDEIDREKLWNIYAKYQQELSPDLQDMARNLRQGGSIKALDPVDQEIMRNASPYLTMTAVNTPYKELSRLQKVGYNIKSAANAINKGKPGQIIVQEGSHLRSKGSNARIVETALKKAERDASIDRIISNYSLLWNKDKKPQGYDTPLIKAAYDKWKEMQ